MNYFDQELRQRILERERTKSRVIKLRNYQIVDSNGIPLTMSNLIGELARISGWFQRFRAAIATTNSVVETINSFGGAEVTYLDLMRAATRKHEQYFKGGGLNHVRAPYHYLRKRGFIIKAI